MKVANFLQPPPPIAHVRLRQELQKLPPDEVIDGHTIAKQFGFSYSTLQQAQDALIAEGYCLRVARGRFKILYGSKKAIAALKAGLEKKS